MRERVVASDVVDGIMEKVDAQFLAEHPTIVQRVVDRLVQERIECRVLALLDVIAEHQNLSDKLNAGGPNSPDQRVDCARLDHLEAEIIRLLNPS